MTVKNQIKHFLGQYPNLFFPVCKAFVPPAVSRECMLADDKELVIEGFPRSANTFAVVAFRQAQGRPVPMAHHLHVEAHILRGVEMGLPVIVLLRNPVDAIKSLLIRHPNTNEQYAFRRYTQFYKAVERVVDKVVLAPFEEVTKNYGAVIQRVNDKFGTAYTLFMHNPESVRQVYIEIEQNSQLLDGGKETHVARPSSKRNQQKAELRLRLKSKAASEALMIWQKLRALA